MLFSWRQPERPRRRHRRFTAEPALLIVTSINDPIRPGRSPHSLLRDGDGLWLLAQT
jgi:hypothetical protein